MRNLINWLRAQLDEDEAAANAATPGPWGMDRFKGGVSVENAHHIVRHDPRHVLADIAAKRAMLDAGEFRCRLVQYEAALARDPMVWVVRTLASGYRHRDGWRAEWET